MTSSDYASTAAKKIAACPVTGPGPTEPDRLAAIHVLEGALRVRHARLRRRRVAAITLSVVATAGAIAAGTFLVRGLTSPAPASLAQSPSTSPAPLTVVARSSEAAAVRLEAGEESALADGRPLTEGAHVVTHGGGHATLELSTGTRLSIEPDAELTILEQGKTQRFALGSGGVLAHVAKLAHGERFLLATPDAEVEVRGTTFRVSLVPTGSTCGEGSRTRVDVSEGVVTVRSHGELVYVNAGTSWPPDCAASDAANGATAAGARTPASPRPRAAVARGAVERPASPAADVQAVRSSKLAEQNDTFARATAARRDGRIAEAIKLYGALAEAPSSEAILAESASVERMKLLRTSDPAAAAVAAQRYLATYPQGFGRAEALGILAERR